MQKLNLKPNISLFSSHLMTPNLSGIQIAIEPKKVVPESKKEVTQIYHKEKTSGALF